MTTWILFLIFHGMTGSGVSYTQGYKTRDACIEAANKIMAESKWDDGSPQFGRYTCTEMPRVKGEKLKGVAL